jgi:diadenosine tetraphosphate (Ap4A) HIT family hydrolase
VKKKTVKTARKRAESRIELLARQGKLIEATLIATYGRIFNREEHAVYDYYWTVKWAKLIKCHPISKGRVPDDQIQYIADAKDLLKNLFIEAIGSQNTETLNALAKAVSDYKDSENLGPNTKQPAFPLHARLISYKRLTKERPGFIWTVKEFADSIEYKHENDERQIRKTARAIGVSFLVGRRGRSIRRAKQRK